MSDYNPEDFLNDVDEAVDKLGTGGDNSGLPQIDMSKKAYTTKKGASYPEFRGSIQILPVVDEATKKPIIFLSDVYVIQCWDEKFKRNTPKFLLEPKFYEKKVTRTYMVDGVPTIKVINNGV